MSSILRPNLGQRTTSSSCVTQVFIGGSSNIKCPLSLTGRDVPRIETRIPITTDKLIHFLEVMAKNLKRSH